MSSSDNVLHLVIADDSLNDAEHLVSVLRNAGLAVRPTRAQDDEALENALDGQSQDLFLCAPGLGNLPMETAIRVLHQSGKDVPMLVLSEEEDHELRREVMGMGAVDLVSKADPDHFRHAVRRELGNVRERRRVRRLEAALRETERRCHTLLDSSRDAIAYVHEGMHVYANASYLERFGFEDFESLEGLPLLDLIASDDQPGFKKFLRRYTNGDRDEDDIEVAIQPQDGTAADSVSMEFSPATWDGEACTQILIRSPVSGGGDLEARLARMSEQDSLTGLFNRSHFIERLDSRIAENLRANDGKQMGLLYIQVDHIEAIRENVGMAAVDVVVGDVAAIVRDQLGEHDIAGRIGDDALTVSLPAQGVHEALAVAEAIRTAVEAHVSEHANRSITKSCSIGVAVLGDGVGSSQEAIGLAYEACTIARREGGDRVHLHAAESADDDAGVEGSWPAHLEEALENESFGIAFQPLIALTGDQGPRYEVRVRLPMDDREPLNPADFMPQAEEHGLASRIDALVLRKVVERLTAQGDRDTTLFLKVSGSTLVDAAFIETLANALETHGTDGRQIVFQLNEPVAVTQLNQAKEFYRAIKEHHCGFTLDEFGSGLNPFQLLKHLPADYVKLDRTLIDRLHEDEASQESVHEIVSTAHDMRKQVIAGYLEEATMLALLWQYEVDLVQGHFLGEPRSTMDYDFSGMVI